MRSTYSTARKFSSGGWCGTALTVYLDGSDGVPVKPITQPFMFTNGMASKACGFYLARHLQRHLEKADGSS